MVQSTITYQGGLRTQAVHGPSKASLLTDAPVDNHGKGEAFSPTDLVGAALGSCVLTLMGITAKGLQKELGAVEVVVDKTMRAAPSRHIGRLQLHIRVPGEWSTDERKALEAAALGCPVKNSLAEQVEIQMDFDWAG